MINRQLGTAMRFPFRYRLSILIVLGGFFVAQQWSWTPPGHGQVQPPAAAETEELSAGPEDDTPQDARADDAQPGEEAADADATQTTPAEPPTRAAEQDADADAAAPAVEGEGAAEDQASEPAAAPADEPSVLGLTPLTLGLMILALLILPIVIGNYAATRLNMPDHGWKISLMLGTILAGAMIVALGDFKFGPDLAGGITLIYELADTGEEPEDAEEDGTASEQTFNPSTDMPDLIAALKERIDPTGTREVVIREFGRRAVEIIIPETGPDALAFVKRRLTDLGQLEFRITADPAYAEERRIIEAAQQVPPSQKTVRLDGQAVAKWVEYDEKEFGPLDRPDERIVKRPAGDTPEALVLLDQMNVTGDYLSNAVKGFDETGGPAVHFSLNRYGAERFRRLTSANRPNPQTGAVRYLGIILDGRLRSSPSIRTTISSQGQISGGSMTEQEVEYTVGILKAGKLPVELNKTPVSEQVISSTIGEETIDKGTFAIGVSLAAVVLFMILYYRLAGFIACMALAINLLLVLAVMILIQAAFTLPGLAGLVLTIGMSVDANVLIYERMREEAARGAAFRMVVRNGFDRASTAIIDSNVTTLITGIVLYAIGTDALKGFAVTLILGILMCMYTAIFCSRIIFDIIERRRMVDTLKMTSILGETHIDFMRLTWPATAASLILIAIGLAAAFARGPNLLDIDFSGGTSVTMVLDQGQEMSVAEVRDVLNDTELEDKNLLVVERGESGADFMINTSVDSVEKVKDILQDAFADKLKSYTVVVEDIAPFQEGNFTGTQANLRINDAPGYENDAGVGHDALFEQIVGELKAQGLEGVEPTLTNPEYKPGSVARFNVWTVRLGGVESGVAQTVLESVKNSMEGTPMFPLASNIGSRVSGNMQVRAIYALLVSAVGIIIYLWIRFQKAIFGIAAIVAIIHDVLMTYGALAVSFYIVNAVPGLAEFLQIDAFQIGLTTIAAFLTIMGYSLNDTIVIFDRIREIRGKSPDITPAMINLAVNQTLSRTILTSLTVLIVLVILYFSGGDGIHNFAFSMLVGCTAGVYSTVFIASPVLVWLHSLGKKETAGSGRAAA